MLIHVFAFFLCASLGTEICAESIGVVPLEMNKRYDKELMAFNTGLYVYDVNGEPIEITKERAQSNNWEGEITFKLYTKQTPTEGQELITNDATNLNNSYFDRSKPTYMITHGWRNNENSPSCVLIRNAYLANTDSNVIVVDWSSYSMSIYYIDVTLEVKGVSERVKQFIKWLYKNEVNADNVTLVGHSLGAHVMGLAGYELKPKVNNIVGLDPALPMYNFADATNSLTHEDANHVQIIHTNGGLLGYACSRGHSDFFPNGGTTQPGCCEETLNCFACSHSRAVDYFAESISKTFNGTECDTHVHFHKNRCGANPQISRMGGLNPESVTDGTYYLLTNSIQPFSEVSDVTEDPDNSPVRQYLDILFRLYLDEMDSIWRPLVIVLIRRHLPDVKLSDLDPDLYSVLDAGLSHLVVAGACGWLTLIEKIIDLLILLQ